MKNLQYKNGKWFESQKPTNHKEIAQARRERKQPPKPIGAEKESKGKEAIKAQQVFEQHLPEGAEVIHASIATDGETYRGIISCRDGGEHKQIRFIN